MAAGKMYLAAKARRPRRASNFKKAVTAIAKKATMRLAETKYAVASTDTNFGTNGLRVPLWENVTQGDGQNNRDGDQVRSLGVTIRGNLLINPTVITSNRDYVGIRMLICSGKRPLTSGDMPGFRDAIDHERLNVLVDRYVNFSTTKSCQFFKKFVKFPRVIPYEGTGVNKNELYVWLIPGDASGGTALTTTTGVKAQFTYHLGFKDI